MNKYFGILTKALNVALCAVTAPLLFHFLFESPYIAGGFALLGLTVYWAFLHPPQYNRHPIAYSGRRPDLEEAASVSRDGIDSVLSGDSTGVGGNPDILIVPCWERGEPRDRWVLTFDREATFGLYDRNREIELRWAVENASFLLPGEFPETATPRLVVRDTAARRTLKLEMAPEDWRRLLTWNPPSARGLGKWRVLYWEERRKTYTQSILFTSIGFTLRAVDFIIPLPHTWEHHLLLLMWGLMTAISFLFWHQAKTNLKIYAERKPPPPNAPQTVHPSEA